MYFKQTSIFNKEPRYNCPKCNNKLYTDWIDNGFGAYSIQASPYICNKCGWHEIGCEQCIKERCFSYNTCKGVAIIQKTD